MSEDRLRRLGEKLRQARLARGETQQQTAAAVGIHRTHLSRVESGQENITVKTLWALADHLGVVSAGLLADRELHDAIAELVDRRAAGGATAPDLAAELDALFGEALDRGQPHPGSAGPADTQPVSD